MTVVYLVIAVLFGFAGYTQCEKKNRDPWLGAALGFFLGIIGLIIVLCLKEGQRPMVQGSYALPPNAPPAPAAPVPSVAPATAQPQVVPSGQRYVAPIVPQYATPQPPQPPAGPQPS